MDIISSHDLRRYEEILDEINSEFEKSEQLKKEIEQVESKIALLRVSLSPNQKKISHVNVKVFSSVSEILNLYDFDANCYDLLNIEKFKRYNFLLVEIILTKTALERLIDPNWRLQISVSAEDLTYCHVVPLKNKNSIFEIIPIDANFYECTVDTRLFSYHENEWTIIDLHSIIVDVSYYFQTFKEADSPISSLENLLNISKLYNESVNLNCVKSPTYLQSQMRCNFDKNNLVSTFVKNSYHRINLELFSDFINDNKRVVDLQFCIKERKVVILFHKDTNVLKIKCSPQQILLLKRFFQQYSICDYQEFKKKFEEIKARKNSLEEMDLEEILVLHQQLRKLWL